MTRKSLTVVVIDDDPDVRDSLGVLLETAGYGVATFAAAHDFLTDKESHTADCALVDVNLPDIDGLQLQAEIRNRGINLPVVIVTGNGDVPLAVKAMRAGAVDFIEKPVDQAHLLDSIQRAVTLKKVQAEASETADDASKRIEALTPREKEVLKLIALGYPNKVIGHHLNISPRTVEVHRARLMDKTQAKTVSDLVRWSMAAGILND